MQPKPKYHVGEQQTLTFGGQTIDFFCVSERGINGGYVGYICPLKDALGDTRYSVRLVIADQEVAVANTLDDAVAALAAYYQKNPPWWHRQTWQDSKCRVRETNRGRLSVDEVGPGKWAAYRKGHELLKGGQTAIFATCEEAQRAADTHLHAGEGRNTNKIESSFAWAE